MLKEWLKKINIKHVIVTCGLCALALFLAVLFYLKFFGYREKEFDVTSLIQATEDQETVYVLEEGQKLVQKFEITIEEATAVSVKISEEQENLADIDLLYSIYDANMVLIQNRPYAEMDVNRDDQLYIHTESPLSPGEYYLSVEVVDHEDTDASIDLLLGTVVNENTFFSNDEITEYSMLIKQSNFIWSNDLYRVLCTVVLIVLVIAIFVFAYFILLKKVEFHWCYMMVALVLGMLFMFIIPPYAVPDEQGHISSSLYLSDKWLGWESQDPISPWVARVTEIKNGFNPYLSRDVYNNYLNKLAQPLSEEGMVIEDQYEGLPSPYALYFIPSLGITLGRLLALNGTATLLLGRIANLIFFVMMATYAIKKIPFGKMVIAGVCLLPITLQQVSSYSYDNPVMAAAMVATALGIRWCYSDEKTHKNELILYLLSSFILLIGKGGAYSFLIFLPFIYRMSKDKLKTIWEKYKLQTIAFMMVSLFIILRNQITAIFGSLLPQQEVVVDGAVETTGNIIVWAGAEGYTVGYLLQNPVQLIKILIETAITYGDWCLGTMLGSSLGWLNMTMPWFLIIACLIILLLATIKPEGEKGELTIVDKLIAIAVAVVSSGICAAGMLILWTPKGSQTILGLQGRYFLPTIAVLLLALRTKGIQIKRNIDRELLYANFVVNIFIIFNILMYSAY